MRVVVAGAGKVGRFLAQELVHRGNEVILIEQRTEVCTQVRQELSEGASLIHGDACELWVLEQADLARADVMVAATGDDEDNLVVSLLAKQEFAVPRVVARVNHPKNAWLFDESWGVDTAMSPPHILTSLIEEAVSVGDLVELLRLEHGKVRLVEVVLPSDSPAIARHLFDLRLPHDAALVAVIRDGHVIIPQPETTLAAGDEVLALTSAETESLFREAILGEYD